MKVLFSSFYQYLCSFFQFIKVLLLLWLLLLFQPVCPQLHELNTLYHKVVFLFQNKPLRKTIYFIYRRKAYIFSNHTPLSGTIKRPENMLSLSEILTYPEFSVQFSENTPYRKYLLAKYPLEKKSTLSANHTYRNCIYHYYLKKIGFWQCSSFYRNRWWPNDWPLCVAFVVTRPTDNLTMTQMIIMMMKRDCKRESGSWVQAERQPSFSPEDALQAYYCCCWRPLFIVPILAARIIYCFAYCCTVEDVDILS